MRKVIVQLSDSEKGYLRGLTESRSIIWQMRTRAKVLLVADELCRESQWCRQTVLAAVADCNVKTVTLVIEAYRTGGVANAVPHEKLAPTVHKALDELEEQELIDMVLNEKPPSDAPRSRWTLRLVAREFEERTGIRLPHSTVRNIWHRSVEDGPETSR